MGCCIAAALIISLARKGWFAIFPGRRPVVRAFAPPARRSAPGASPAASQPAVLSPVAVRRGGEAPIAIAATVALYVTTIALLRMAGSLVEGSDPVIPWLARDLVLAGVFGLALAIAHGRAARDVPRFLAFAGTTWSVLAIADMHVFGLFDLASPLADIVFHGSGFLVLCIGLATRRPIRPIMIPDTEGVLL